MAFRFVGLEMVYLPKKWFHSFSLSFPVHVFLFEAKISVSSFDLVLFLFLTFFRFSPFFLCMSITVGEGIVS